MNRGAPPRSDDWIQVVPGRLHWRGDGTGLVSGQYRIRLLGPGRWETTFRGRPISVDERRSMAMAMAEQHHHEVRRKHQIVGFGVTAGVSLVVAVVGLSTLTPVGFFVFVAGIGLFLGFGARSIAASTRNLLDPYRIREPWERSDWWTEH